MAKLIERKIYTDSIKGFFDNGEFIKVITGVRRSGKSGILKLVMQEALKHTNKDHIIFLDFEDYSNSDLLKPKVLHQYVLDKIKDDKTYFVFLDEIQKVEEWESVVASLRKRNTDIYITGSNAQLLSGEFATNIAGRCVSFSVYPLSFREFFRFRVESGFKKYLEPTSFPVDESHLDEFVKVGGFPALSTKDYSDDEIRRVVTDIHSTAVLKDVVERNKIKNVPLLQRIIAYLYDNVGNLTSIKKIVDYLQKEKVDFETVSSYIGYLENAFIINKVSRYDIKGKKLLESNYKFYLADHSLQYAIREIREDNKPGILENIVYNELIRRGYKVYVGKMSKDDSREIDFVAEKNNGDEKVYVQVCYEFTTPETKEREYAPLLDVKDHFPKYVVSYKLFGKDGRNGVVGIQLKDFLLKESF